MGLSATVPEEHREVLDAPYAVLTTLTANDENRFARHVGRRYGG